MRDLTRRQEEIFKLIREWIETTGLPPTRAEIAQRFGFSSPNAAEQHLKALAKKGVLELVPGASRGIRLADGGGLPLLKVRGMSMKDAGILDGDLLAVHRSAEARAGQVVVARIGDEVTVKRFQKRGHTVRLLPENPDFEPIAVDLARQDFAIEGIAVGVIRNGNGW
ncbi:MAG: repressor LexA [Thiobacillus sp.]|nr:repressor LexA [Thiobacillus sp.]